MSFSKAGTFADPHDRALEKDAWKKRVYKECVSLPPTASTASCISWEASSGHLSKTMSDVEVAPDPQLNCDFSTQWASLSSFDSTRTDGFGQPAQLQRPPTHMDEPECVISSDLFISQVGTVRPREGNHFLVGWWAGHTINFLKELLFFLFLLKIITWKENQSHGQNFIMS